MAHAQFLWIVQTPKFTNHLCNPLCLLASEQSSIMWNVSHNLHCNHFGSISLLLPISLVCMYIHKNEHQIAWRNGAPRTFLCYFLPNKLTPFNGMSLFGFSTTICPPRHHENSATLSGWKLQEYLALSPEDCGTN